MYKFKNFVLVILIISLFAFNAKSQPFLNPYGSVLLPSQDVKFEGKRDFILEKEQEQLWQKFFDENGKWTVIFDNYTKTPMRALGKAIKIKGFETVNNENIEDAGKSFLNEYSEVFRINVNDLKLIKRVKVNKLWYLGYIQQYKGIDVLLSEIELRINEKAEVIAFGITFYNDINIETTPKLSSYDAMKYATKGLEDSFDKSDYILSEGKLYILPIKTKKGIDYRLVYNYLVNSEDETEKFSSYVDANLGEVLWRQNLVFDIETKIKAQGYVKKKAPVDEPKLESFSDLFVTVNGEKLTTNENGEIIIDASDSVQVTSTLEGKWAKITTSGQPVSTFNGKFAPGIENKLIWDNSNSKIYERCIFYYANYAHNYIKNIDPQLSCMDFQMGITISLSGSPNAMSSGNKIQYVGVGNSSYRMAETPDVYYHEYGHSINSLLYQYLGKQEGMINYSLHEALADINSCLILDVPEVGKGFMVANPDEFIRTLSNNLKYPNDLTGESHHDGQILGGALWDLRKSIDNLEYVRYLTHYTKYGTPDDPDVGLAYKKWFIETIITDDNLSGDGDLSNGTPHLKEIIQAFNNHNIGTGLIVLTSFAHNEYSDTKDTLKPYKIECNLERSFLNYDIVQDVWVVYTTDNFATINKIKAELIDDKYVALIPPQKFGSFVQYYFEVYDKIQEENIILLKSNNSVEPFGFLVGYETIFFDDFETDKGWTVGSSQDNATRGTWERADPQAVDLRAYGYYLVQTGDNHTPGGLYCFVTGSRGGLNYTQYAPNGRTTFVSPIINLNNMVNPIVRYYQWFFNLQNTYDPSLYGRLVIEVSSDGGANWVIVKEYFNPTNDWEKKQFCVNDYVVSTDSFRIRFICDVKRSGTSTASLTEALIDDFEILAAIPNQIVSVEKVNTDFYKKLICYPNPVTDEMNIILDGFYGENVSFSILNLFGEEIYSQKNIQANNGNMTFRWDRIDNKGNKVASGIYFVQVKSGKNSFIEKIIIND